MTLGMTGSGHTDVLASVLADFVVGKNVKRAKLYLVWEGKDVSAEFINALMRSPLYCNVGRSSPCDSNRRSN